MSDEGQNVSEMVHSILAIQDQSNNRLQEALETYRNPGHHDHGTAEKILIKIIPIETRRVGL